MAKITMNVTAERDSIRTSSEPKQMVPSRIYAPLPDKSGAKAKNGIIIPVCYPSLWKLFNPSASDAAKYNLVGESSQGPIAIPSDLSSFFFKIPMHPVANFTRADGSVGFANTVCPVCFNKYLTEVLQYGPLFNNNVRCAYCEEESSWWNQHNQAWEELGYTQESKKALSKDKYRSIMDSSPQLKKTRDNARKYKAQEKYVLPIFDYDTYNGIRPMREGQTSVENQVWFASSGLFEKLADLCEIAPEGQEFYSVESPQGVQLLYLVKDTTNCSPGDMLQTKYDIIQGPRVNMDQAWVEYLMNPETQVDPSDYIQLVSYEEQKYYLGGGDNGGATVATKPQMPPRPPVPFRAPAPVPSNNAQNAPEATEEPEQVEEATSMPQQTVTPPVAVAAPPKPPMPSPVPSPIPARAPVPSASPVNVIPQAQMPNRTAPTGAPPKGKRSW
jgi:hypothetical protein